MFSLQVEYKGYPPEKRKWNEALVQTFLGVGRDWHQEYYEKHFTHEGAAEYGYYKRKGELLTRGSAAYRRSYTGRKERTKGHTLPLRYSDTAYRQGKVALVSANSKGGKVKLPSVFNYKNPKSRIVMREEITRVSGREQDHLRARADVHLQKALTAAGQT